MLPFASLLFHHLMYIAILTVLGLAVHLTVEFQRFALTCLPVSFQV